MENNKYSLSKNMDLYTYESGMIALHNIKSSQICPIQKDEVEKLLEILNVNILEESLNKTIESLQK